MMRGKNIKNCTKNIKTCNKKTQIAKNAKNAKKIAIFLKIAKNHGRDFPEGQVMFLFLHDVGSGGG